MENHSPYDVITSKTFSEYSPKEKQKLFALAKALIEAGDLWTTYEENELPILVAGLAKHCPMKNIKLMSIELINMISSSARTC